MYLATQYSWPSVRDLHAAVLYKIECAGQVGVILSLIWSHEFYKLCCGLLARDPRTQIVLQLVSSAEIISMVCVNFKRITTALCVARENGCSTFVPNAGWIHESPRITPSSRRSALWPLIAPNRKQFLLQTVQFDSLMDLHRLSVISLKTLALICQTLDQPHWG